LGDVAAHEKGVSAGERGRPGGSGGAAVLSGPARKPFVKESQNIVQSTVAVANGRRFRLFVIPGAIRAGALLVAGVVAKWRRRGGGVWFSKG